MWDGEKRLLLSADGAVASLTTRKAPTRRRRPLLPVLRNASRGAADRGFSVARTIAPCGSTSSPAAGRGAREDSLYAELVRRHANSSTWTRRDDPRTVRTVSTRRPDPEVVPDPYRRCQAARVFLPM